jgi:thioredoxin 1
MNKAASITIIVVLLIVVAAAVVVKRRNQTPQANEIKWVDPNTQLPRLVDFGAGKCRMCKMMEPILEELRSEYSGILAVNYVDVYKNSDITEQHSVQIIPTQIFFDASGKELFRHEGFFSKEDILSKWKELGFELAKTE